MMPKLDPKKMQAIMKQMGLSQEEIDADRVVIEQPDGDIIIENPQVIKVNMSGQENFQISGEVKHMKNQEGKEAEKLEQDLKTIIEQTGVSEDIAAIELEKNKGDIAETIIQLSKKGKKK